ncbi:MAG: FtsQ-type POTRA domain-containing protein [Oscillospiraceae bacterium]|jgi:hypothetical protein|nr:FtsQ-type POTRA domain-containing protein [Oscillospiraceae bacterium]
MPKAYAPKPGETADQTTERIGRARRITALGVLAGFGFLLAILSYFVLFPLRNFDVQGATRYSKTALQNAAVLPDGKQLLGIKPALVEKDIQEALPYVERVEVQLRLPRTLRVTVHDARTLLAVKLDKDEYLILSGKGKVLEFAQKAPSESIPLTLAKPAQSKVGDKVVFDDDAEKNKWMQEVFDAFVAAYENCAFTEQITALDLTQPYFPVMTYAGRVKMRLGSHNSFANQLDYGRHTLDYLEQEAAAKKEPLLKGTLDLSGDGWSYFRQ